MLQRAVVGVLLVATSASADRAVGVEVTASSAAPKREAWRAVDGESSTAWCEGKDTEGLDETIKLTLAEPIKVTRLDLYVGMHGSAKEYAENNVPSKLFAQTAPKTGAAMVLLAKATPMTSKHSTLVKLDLKTPRTIQVLELGLAGVTRGKSASNATCIADISLVGEKGEIINFLYGLSADAMSQLQPAVNVLSNAVANCNEKALAYLVKFPLEHHVAAEEDSKTFKHKSVKTLVAACKKTAFPPIPVDKDEWQLTPAGLGRVSIEPSNSDVIRFEMQWVDNSWRLARIESH